MVTLFLYSSPGKGDKHGKCPQTFLTGRTNDMILYKKKKKTVNELTLRYKLVVFLSMGIIETNTQTRKIV